jgi:dolichol-phosphate mannosyltransferase
VSIVPVALVRFLKFGSVGVSGVLVNQAALWFSREHVFAGLSPHLALNAALAVAVALATINNYFWNRWWTWRDRDRTRSAVGTLAQFGRYCAAVALGTAVQFAVTNLLAAFFRYLLANLCAIAMASGVNFAMNNRWTFRGRRVAAPVLPLESSP